MTERLFGTDGMRGRAGEEPLTPATLTRLGRALAEHLRSGGREGEPASATAAAGSLRVLLGHDGRESGETLAAGLTKGLNLGGVSVDVVGLAPTPCVAYLTESGPYQAGVVVSASHNPAQDNGVKLLGPDGAKLADELEEALEQQICSGGELAAVEPAGETRRTKGMVGDYIAWLRNEAFPKLELKGWRIALDAANGAYSQLGPRILRAFGAEPVAVSCKPDGHNINLDCGALHPEQMASVVVDQKCHIGLSVDGDGDRGILADGQGRILDGDALLAGFGVYQRRRGALPGRTVVATVMSNLALERYLEAAGVRMLRVPVGDRYVAAAMREGGYVLGGEKSGHMLFGAEHGFRGDGVYTLLRAIRAMLTEEIEPSEFAYGYKDLPQRLVNLPVTKRLPVDELPRLSKEMQEAASQLGEGGRVVVRFSGTELRLRLMVEAESEALVDSTLERLSRAARADGILA